jgi:hypothetical protein
LAKDPEIQEDEAGRPGPPEMQLVYANTAGIRGGPFDASLEFGYVIPPGEGEDPRPPIWAVRVAMSWEHVRALHELLGAQLKKYEAQVGKLPDIEKLKVGDHDDNS